VVVRDADEDNLLRRSSLDNRLRKDVKTVVDILRKAEVEDILRDATEEKDIPAVAVLMDNPEVDSEIGILEEDTIPVGLCRSSFFFLSKSNFTFRIREFFSIR
jgi:hypothetical protein